MLRVIISYYLSKLTAQIPYSDHPYVESITSTTRWAYVSFFTQIQRLIPAALRSQEPDALTLSEVADTFTRLFQEIRTSAFADTGVKIAFAVIGVPDFFNNTLADIVIEASREAGIKTLSGSSVLVLHHGKQHCGIRLSNGESHRNKRPRDVYLSLEPWRSQGIYRQLTTKLIRSNPSLKTQVDLGADEEVLITRVMKARLLLKNQDPVVEFLGMESQSADFYKTIEDCEGEYQEELPLELDDWWVYGSNPGVKLTRELVLDADRRYVESLRHTIDTLLRASQEAQSMQPQEIDQVVILTDWVDGDLVRRAVKEAFGDGIPIIGGSLGNITMAADGAARISLVRRQNLLRRQATQSLLGHDEL
ncbi:hypothetical protein BDV12DRAFT_200252 [Aspergillus spectabilis]